MRIINPPTHLTIHPPIFQTHLINLGSGVAGAYPSWVKVEEIRKQYNFPKESFFFFFLIKKIQIESSVIFSHIMWLWCSLKTYFGRCHGFKHGSRGRSSRYSFNFYFVLGVQAPKNIYHYCHFCYYLSLLLAIKQHC